MTTRRWLAVGCGFVLAFVLAVLAIVLFVFWRPFFFRLLAMAGVVLTLFSVVAMVRAARRATVVSIKAQMLSVAVSILSVLVFVGLLGSRVGILAWLLAPVFGGMIGIVWCFTTRLRWEDGVVRRQGNVLSLAVWGMIFVLQQALVALLGRVPATGTVLLLLGTGIAVGQATTLIARVVLLRSTAS